ncbi:MAG TPA: TrmH family RNA methyltransferase, partial [Amnibacterium sp.]|nr:TrmH family RNA methyltransferase [Amnibacterium sp.]
MIDGPRSAAVRRVAGLKQKRARSETGLALLEGPQVVREVVVHHPELVTELYVTADAAARHGALVAAAREAGIEVELASESAIAAMADTRTPQGVVAVARQAPVRLRDAVPDRARLVVVLDGVQDPGNAGTIIRAADAAGADAVILTGSSVDPYNPKVVRSTTGSLFHLPVATGAGLAAALDVVRGAGLA